MSTAGQRAVRDALRQRDAEFEQGLFAQATVTAVSARTATVRFPGADGTQTWPRVNPSLGIAVGDIVVMAGRIGSWVCLGTITDVRNLAAYDLTVTHDLAVGNNLVAQNGLRAELGLSSGGETVVGTVLSVGTRARGPNWSSSLYDGALRWNANGAGEFVTYDGSAYRGVYASNFAPPPSWRALKTDTRTLAEHLGGMPGEVVDGLRLDSAWRYNDDVPFADGIEHIGPKLDEVPVPLHVWRTDPDTGEDRSSWDVVGMLTVALAALQETRAEVRDLRAELGELKADRSAPTSPS